MQRVKTALEMVSTVLVIAAAGALLWTHAGPKSSAATPAAAVADVKDTIEAAHVTNVVGTGDLAIVEFSDFQCPFCAQHARESFPTLKEALIDAGKVRYVSMAFPLTEIHPFAEAAAVAAECAARQGKYWEMHDALFETQSRLEDASASSFDGAARLIGLDESAFATCVTGPDALAKVRADGAEANRLDVKSTPSFFIGRPRADGGIDLLKRISGAAPASAFVTTIAALQKEAQ